MPKTIARRVTELEKRMQSVERASEQKRAGMRWLELVAGSNEGDADFKKAMQLGAKYRKRQPKC